MLTMAIVVTVRATVEVNFAVILNYLHHCLHCAVLQIYGDAGKHGRHDQCYSQVLQVLAKYKNIS
jgi:hypothetical protein